VTCYEKINLSLFQNAINYQLIKASSSCIRLLSLVVRSKKLSSARTKTKAIYNSVLAPYSVEVAFKPSEESSNTYCEVSNYR